MPLIPPDTPVPGRLPSLDNPGTVARLLTLGLVLAALPIGWYLVARLQGEVPPHGAWVDRRMNHGPWRGTPAGWAVAAGVALSWALVPGGLLVGGLTALRSRQRGSLLVGAIVALAALGLGVAYSRILWVID